jgi:hypothetical protein
MTSTGEKTRLLIDLDIARNVLMQVIEKIDPTTEIYPNWTIRHVLAHITGWDEATAASLRAYVKGEESAIASYRGINEYNARSVETRQDLNYNQTFKECLIARQELKEAIRSMPDDKFGSEILYPWGARNTVTGLIQVIIDHEHGHAEEIKNLKLKKDENNSPSG